MVDQGNVILDESRTVIDDNYSMGQTDASVYHLEAASSHYSRPSSRHPSSSHVEIVQEPDPIAIHAAKIAMVKEEMIHHHSELCQKYNFCK